MRIEILKMAQSVFNRSIWEGFHRAFLELRCDVVLRDAESLTVDTVEPDGLDLVLAVHGGTVPVEAVGAYRRAGVPTAVYLLDEPYEVDRSSTWSRHYDYAFTVDRETVAHHEPHRRAEFLPLGYDAGRFHPEGKAYASEILVLGSPYDHRLQMLSPLRRRWGRHITWVGPGWAPFCSAGRHVEQLITPDICARFYRGAQIVVNIHRDSVWSHFGETNRRRIRATHLNPRFWEAAACGAFQLTSYRSDLDALCPSARSFETADELASLLDRYWDAPEERRHLASLMKGAIETHSYRHRAESLLLTISGLSASHAGSRPEAKEISRKDDK